MVADVELETNAIGIGHETVKSTISKARSSLTQHEAGMALGKLVPTYNFTVSVLGIWATSI